MQRCGGWSVAAGTLLLCLGLVAVLELRGAEWTRAGSTRRIALPPRQRMGLATANPAAVAAAAAPPAAAYRQDIGSSERRRPAPGRMQAASKQQPPTPPTPPPAPPPAHRASQPAAQARKPAPRAAEPHAAAGVGTGWANAARVLAGQDLPEVTEKDKRRFERYLRGSRRFKLLFWVVPKVCLVLLAGRGAPVLASTTCTHPVCAIGTLTRHNANNNHMQRCQQPACRPTPTGRIHRLFQVGGCRSASVRGLPGMTGMCMSLVTDQTHLTLCVCPSLRAYSRHAHRYPLQALLPPRRLPRLVSRWVLQLIMRFAGERTHDCLPARRKANSPPPLSHRVAHRHHAYRVRQSLISGELETR